LGIGVWWLVFFNRARVKAQFVAPPPMFTAVPPPQMPAYSVPPPPSPAVRAGPDSSRGRPLSITIIAWYLLAICVLIPLNLLLHSPVMLFVAVLTGRPAVIYSLALVAVHIYVGIGLLRLQPVARLVGISYFMFAFLNSAVFFLAPGGSARVARLMALQQSMFPWMRAWQNQLPIQFDIAPFIVIGAVGGLVFLLIPLYFLFTSKQVFAEAAPGSAA
jgi:hypothetical protein